MSSPREWARVRRILEVALPLEKDEQKAALDEHCGGDPALRCEVESLLAAHSAAGTFLDQPHFSLNDQANLDDWNLFDDRAITKLGPYRIDKPLGQGGMGAVYLAHRADRTFEKNVAIKLLKRGLETDAIVRRFRSERQILANLEHPNIARLIDGGSSGDGRPYLVMEYVDGEPIDHFCDRQQLQISDRLRLFQKVCATVHFAHQNLVIHRDLKPSNILITPEGEPKLLDFGIAKLLDGEAFPITLTPTEPGLQPMTPEYASPEQLRGARVTTASDVYSLGVLLYELLTGQRPISVAGLDRQAQIQAVFQSEAVKPSEAISRWRPRSSEQRDTEGTSRNTLDPGKVRNSDRSKLRRRLQGDLDTILFQALHKQPERRYATVESFSRDLERHLDGRPVSARPDSWSYRAGKWIARNKLTAIVALAATLALIAFTTTLWLQRNRILQEQRRANEVAEFMIDLFETSDPYRGLGERVTVLEILTVGAGNLDSELRADPEIRTAIRQAVGRSMTNLALYREARPLLEKALAERRELHGKAHPSVAATLHLLADLDIHEGSYRNAEGRYREALQLRRNLFGERGPEVAESLHGLALTLDALNRLPEADSAYRQALEIARRLDETQRGEILAPQLDQFAEFLREQDSFAEARALIEEGLAIRRELRGENHPAVALSLNNLALLVKHEDRQEAEELLEQAERIQRQAFAQPHAHLALTLINLGRLLHEGQHLEESRNRFEEAAAIQAKVFRGPHPRRATTLDLLAGVQADLGEIAAAIERRREVLEMRRQMFGEHHVEFARSCNSLAKLLTGSGHYGEAEELYRKSLEVVRSNLGESHRHVAVLVNNLGEIAAHRNQLPEALELFSDSVSRLRATVAPSSPLLAKALTNLGSCQRRQGRLDAAEASLNEALEIARQRWTLESPRTAEITLVLATLQNDRGAYEKAEASTLQALRALQAEAMAGRPAQQTALAEVELGRSLVGQGQAGAAEVVNRHGWLALSELQGTLKPERAKPELAAGEVGQYQSADSDSDLAKDLGPGGFP